MELSNDETRAPQSCNCQRQLSRHAPKGMLSGAVRFGATSCSIVKHVRTILAPLWQDGDRKLPLGLAISGGVDSMALATICRLAEACSSHRSFQAFIVDHALRDKSGSEAVQVAEELDRLGIKPSVLKLDWSGEGIDPRGIPNFETVARRLRYQALGRACYASGIRDLLVAHHADDLAETVLVRILSGYTGSGLSGIASKANIPACEGLYGVDRSGGGVRDAGKVAGMVVETGGVTIRRPLLPFTKEQLVAVCEEAETKWFEDPTNTVPSVTIRNTVRHLLKKGSLPVALRRERLLQLAVTMQTKRSNIEESAGALFDRVSMVLDLRFGTLTFTLDEPLLRPTSNHDQDYHIQATLLRRLLALVSPAPHISLQELDTAMDYVFSAPTTSTTSTTMHRPIQVYGVQISQSPAKGDTSPSRRTFLLHRSLPPRRQTPDLHLGPLDSYDASSGTWHTQPEWQLWDSRYWFRVRRRTAPSPDPPPRFAIRYLDPARLGSLRKSLDRSGRDSLQKALAGVSPPVRRVLPVLSIMGDETGQGERVLALPTVPWENPNVPSDTWEWDVRYKNVDFERTHVHVLIS